MKRANFTLSLYVLIVLLVTPMLTLAGHSVSHVGHVVGGTILAGLLVGFVAKLLARRFG